jgi:hypothetical protein
MLGTRNEYRHIKDYESAIEGTLGIQHAGNLTEEQNVHPVQIRDYPYNEATEKKWCQRFGMSYTEDKHFDWYRGFHVGGKSLMWDDKVIVLAIIILKTMLVMGMGMV